VLKVVSLDIETSQHEALYSIALDGMEERVVFMLGEPPSGSASEPASEPACAPDAPLDFSLVYCPTRKAMIESLNDWFERNDPDVLIGWNVIQFDLRVLQKNADDCGAQLLLGPRAPAHRVAHPSRQAGLPVRAHAGPRDHRRHRRAQGGGVELSVVQPGDRLADAAGRGQGHRRRVRQDGRDRAALPAGQARAGVYNIKDCELVLRIFEKAKLLQFMMERAHATGLQADHFGGSIAAFSHHYLPRMHRLGYVAPSVGEIASKAYPGGYVMDSKPGFYDSVVVLDYKSLYPSIIRTFLVDPVGLMEGSNAAADEDTVKGPQRTAFSREKHCLPEIVTTLWRARDEAKRTRNEPLSQALKLLMNSFAGVLGASECRFFNPRLVSAITLRGHEMMKLTRDFVEQRGYEVIYGDTDSIFIWLKRPHTNDEAHAVAATLVREINDWWSRTLREEQGLQNLLEIEFDTHYRKFFMPTIRGSDVGSKKRYAGLSVDAAGKEEMVYRGLEMARSDWTPLARQFQEGLLSRIFQGEPYKAFVTDYARATLAGGKDDLLIYRKRLRHRLDDYQVNVPPQVRAARIADDYNASVGRPMQYQNGGWIQYVMTRNGPEPLETRRSRIDYEHYLGKQLQPIADAILQPMGESFMALTTAQQGLF
jgi:DNA polymerase-2